VKKQIEHLWLDMNDALGTLEFAPIGIETEIIEL
jgi:hypothetical protein